MSGAAPRTTPEPEAVAVRGPETSPPIWRLRTRRLVLDRPILMGVLNLTPDSFSDGGRYATPVDQLAHAERLVESGAQILDLGAESTRPGASAVAPAEQLDRLGPLLERVVELDVAVSIDTRSSEVATEALRLGAEIVNDVSGFHHDPGMASVVAESGAGVVLMHMRGTPADMTEHAHYEDLCAEVSGELAASLRTALNAGVGPDRIVLDPGIGFAKTVSQSLALLGNLGSIMGLGRPVLVGPSRKRFLAGPEELPPDARVPGTVAACVIAYQQGVRLFRVHDVEPVRRALDVARRVQRTTRGERTSRPGNPAR